MTSDEMARQLARWDEEGLMRMYLDRGNPYAFLSFDVNDMFEEYKKLSPEKLKEQFLVRTYKEAARKEKLNENRKCAG